MTEPARGSGGRRRHAARAARRLALGLSIGGFGALMTWLPLAAESGSAEATSAPAPVSAPVPGTVPGSTAAAPPPQRVVRVVVRRHLYVTEGAPAASSGSAGVRRTPVRGAVPAAPAPVAAPAPPPPPPPAPAPVASSHGSR